MSVLDNLHQLDIYSRILAILVDKAQLQRNIPQYGHALKPFLFSEFALGCRAKLPRQYQHHNVLGVQLKVVQQGHHALGGDLVIFLGICLTATWVSQSNGSIVQCVQCVRVQHLRVQLGVYNRVYHGVYGLVQHRVFTEEFNKGFTEESLAKVFRRQFNMGFTEEFIM